MKIPRFLQPVFQICPKCFTIIHIGTRSGRLPSANQPVANKPKTEKELSFPDHPRIPGHPLPYMDVAEILLAELVTAYEKLHWDSQPGKGLAKQSPTDQRYIEAVAWVNRREIADREAAEREAESDGSLR